MRRCTAQYDLHHKQKDHPPHLSKPFLLCFEIVVFYSLLFFPKIAAVSYSSYPLLHRHRRRRRHNCTCSKCCLTSGSSPPAPSPAFPGTCGARQTAPQHARRCNYTRHRCHRRAGAAGRPSDESRTPRLHTPAGAPERSQRRAPSDDLPPPPSTPPAPPRCAACSLSQISRLRHGAARCRETSVPAPSPRCISAALVCCGEHPPRPVVPSLYENAC